MSKWIIGLVLVVGTAGCTRPVRLDTETFTLAALDDETALTVVDPYVYADRPTGPGRATAVNGLLTVRETRDNLDKIARVLSEHDRPLRTVGLSFQVIMANGATAIDSSIAEVERELRRLFRFEGYRLAAEATLRTLERHHVSQQLFDRRPPARDSVRRVGDFVEFEIFAEVGQVRSEGTTGTVNLRVSVRADGISAFETALNVRLGDIVVVGSMQLPSDQALIVSLRADLIDP